MELAGTYRYPKRMTIDCSTNANVEISESVYPFLVLAVLSPLVQTFTHSHKIHCQQMGPIL